MRLKLIKNLNKKFKHHNITNLFISKS